LPGRRCVVVGGAGAVGTLFAELLLAAGADVCLVDVTQPSAPGFRYERGDVTAIQAGLAAELGRADIVVLAVPEPVALDAVERLAAILRPGTLLVDTLSVKSRIVASLDAGAGHLEALSLNPMFAPSLGIDGRAVAAVVVNDGPLAQELLALLRARGGRVVIVGAERHDELAAVSQALTHASILAFGLALAELDADVAELSELAPPPHLTLLAMLARITGGQAETYWDVQAANPFAEQARATLADAMRRLADVVDRGDEAGFGVLLEQLGDRLGHDAGHYRALSADLFSVAAPPPATATMATTHKEGPRA
jgi:prephenate dehydrogenase